ncbi:MAG: AsnC family transcriptional regulator, partial [Haliea sp.]
MERKLHTLNRTDRRLLRLLQQDARTSYAELARQVGLSTTPCKERIKRLEREDV